MTGNLGIGTASPTLTILSLYTGAASTNLSMIIRADNPANQASITFYNNLNKIGAIGLGGSSVGAYYSSNLYLTSPKDINFFVNAGTTPSMCISSTGGVGINTTVATGAQFEVSDGTNKTKIGGTNGGAHHITSTNNFIFNTALTNGYVAVFRNLVNGYDNLAGYNDRMTIGNTGVNVNNNLTVGGNVGINSSSPNYALDINGQARVYNGTSATNFYIGNGNAAAALNLWDINTAAWRITTGGYNLSFDNGSVNGTLTTRMVINSSGNVGINGTPSTNANVKLFVNGEIQIGATSIIPLNTVEQRIINTGSTLTGIFAGDVAMSSYWGIAMNLNLGGNGDSSDAGYAKIAGTSSFTINTRTSGTVANGFDRTLFYVRNSGDTYVYGTFTSGGTITSGAGITTANNANSFLGGLRINGNDTANTIYQASGNIGITMNYGANPSGFLGLGFYGGNGYILKLYNTYITMPAGVSFQLLDSSGGGGWSISSTTSPTSFVNSLLFNHIANGINSKWWFNGTQTATSAEISDERIKKNVEPINDALSIINKLQPKKYDLIDDKDVNKRYGFIAQEVEAIPELSNLIFTDTEFICNINCYGNHSNLGDNKALITANKNIAGLVNVDDNIKIVFNNKNNQEFIIDSTPYHNRYKRRYLNVLEIVDDNSFIVDKELTIDETDPFFIYGKEVNDFKRLDYQSFHALNTSAIQELYKITQAQQDQINKLTNIISQF